DPPVAGTVRMGVRLGHPPMGCPARMGQADGRGRRGGRPALAAVGATPVEADPRAKVGQVADRPHRLDVPVLEQRYSGRVVAPVLQLLEPGDQQVPAWTLAYISDDPTHGKGEQRSARR